MAVTGGFVLICTDFAGDFLGAVWGLTATAFVGALDGLEGGVMVCPKNKRYIQFIPFILKDQINP
ncbi:MAG: hypothetical protein ABIO88_11140 [Burkholderiaceae bacterium]